MMDVDKKKEMKIEESKIGPHNEQVIYDEDWVYQPIYQGSGKSRKKDIITLLKCEGTLKSSFISTCKSQCQCEICETGFDRTERIT